MSKEVQEPVAMRKMTLKEICGMNRGTSAADVKAHFLKLAEQQAEIAVIAGEVDGCGGKQTAFGEALFVTGDFVAVNRITGQSFTATKLYLPKDAAETIVGKWKGRTNQDDVINFKLMVQVVADAAAATGYVFICKPLRTTEQVTRQRELLGELAALPAPKPLKAIAGKK